jgi:TolB-like protein/DNA-binding winged helix-turn-helix (wHTH) protein
LDTEPKYPERVRFADFEFACWTGDLRRNGESLRLQPQPAKVLALLVRRAGQVVTRRELATEIWGDGTFVDFEQGLNYAIRQIRTALADDADSPRFLETVPKRGYRFIAKVESHPVEEKPESPAVVPIANPKSRKRIALAVTIAAAATVAFFVLVNWGRLRAGWIEGNSSHRIQSLAVLPLRNLSNDPEQEYFSDGMTDELITDLAKFGGVRVISHTSVERYKETRRPLPEIARELGVDAVVEGTVTRSGDRVRITAQLIDAHTDQHLWAESYERDLRDIFSLQNEVAIQIASEVGVKLTNHPQAIRSREVNPSAHEAYLRGRYWWHRRGPEAEMKGLQFFEQSVELDPSYALGWDGVADSYLVIAHHGGMPANEAMPKAKAAALKAVELDPSLAESHASLAIVKLAYDWDYSGAEAEFRRAIQLNPNYATAHHWYAHQLVVLGRFPEALHEIKLAHELDPYSITISYFWGETLYYSHDYGRSLDQFRSALDLDADSTYISWWWGGLANVYEQQRDYPHALELRRKLLAMSGDVGDSTALARAYAATGADGYWRERLRLMKKAPAMDLAIAYARQGDREAAFSELNRAYEEHSPWLNFIGVEPAMDPLRADPRFGHLMTRLGIIQR